MEKCYTVSAVCYRLFGNDEHEINRVYKNLDDALMYVSSITGVSKNILHDAFHNGFLDIQYNHTTYIIEEHVLE